jgi:putative ATP-dependent endonuclease of the OLD family
VSTGLPRKMSVSMQIRRIKIARYRGIQQLLWCPGRGVNCLIGPGDVGKSTVLDAIATVLSPAPGRVASEYDYFEGAVSEGFTIEVVLGELDDEVLSAWSVAPLWTWWADREKVQPDPDPDGEAVLCVRAKGTEDLEIEHVVVDPSEGETHLSPLKRQKFGLSTMGSAATAYQELRMSRGSLLFRNVEHEQLRSLVTDAVQAARDSFSPSEEVTTRLGALSEALHEVAPDAGDLALAMLSPRGQSLLGMIGLFSRRGKVGVPIANAGLGTQQLALFTLARLLIVASPLFVIDEIENGLEPFRQRDLIARVRKTIGPAGQAFITTHSPAVIGELGIHELYRIDPAAGECDVTAVPDGLERIRRQDSEGLLCRLPALVEGQTELGLLECLLEEQAENTGTSLGALGIRLIDGDGQPSVFKVTDALRGTGQRFAAFLDTEETHVGKREELRSAQQVAFGTWSEARCVEDALSKQLSLEHLDRLIATPGLDGRSRSDARLQQLNQHIAAQSRKTLVELATEHDEEDCRTCFSEVANKCGWFKTRADAIVVGRFLLEHRPDIQIVTDVNVFWEATISLMANRGPIEGPVDDGPEP